MTLGDITGSRELQRAILMIIPFRYREDMKDSELITVAAADLGESVVESIVAFRGNPKKKKELEFQVLWEDFDLTWEPYEKVRHLRCLDDFVVTTNNQHLLRTCGIKR